MTGARRGRPPGYTLNPDAFADHLGARSQASVATAAHISPSHLAEMIAGDKGATHDVALRIAGQLNVRPGTLFPELVTFRVVRREFAATIDGALVEVA